MDGQNYENVKKFALKKNNTLPNLCGISSKNLKYRKQSNCGERKVSSKTKQKTKHGQVNGEEGGRQYLEDAEFRIERTCKRRKSMSMCKNKAEKEIKKLV